MEKLDYETYITERRQYADAAREGARSFDKAILTLASGAFGVTVIFLRDLVPEISQRASWWLMTSWIMFAASIFCTLASFLGSQWACSEQIRELDERNDATFVAKPSSKRRANVLVLYCNGGAMVTLALAFISWMTFVSMSFNLEVQVSDEQHTTHVPAGTERRPSSQASGHTKGFIPQDAPRPRPVVPASSQSNQSTSSQTDKK